MTGTTSTKKVMIASVIWLLLIGACLITSHPSITNSSIGSLARSITPNPFWAVRATDIPASPFSVTAKWGYILGVALVPLVTLWSVVLVWRRALQSRSGAAV